MASNFNKEDWLEWCTNPVTQELYAYIQDQINSETWSLIENGGESIHQAARSSGKILSMGDILNWKPELLAAEVEDVIVVPEEGEEDA